MNTSILLPLLLNAAGAIACGAALWIGQSNHKAPRIKSTSSPLARELNNNPLFRAFDRVPLFRRSGNATVNDLAKALFIMLAISFLPAAISMPLPIVLWASALLLATVSCILFMHPFLSHRQSFSDNVRGKSLSESEE